MYKLIGCSMMLLGLALGAYVGVYVMLIGGIIQLVTALQSDPISATEVAFGVARILTSSLVGWVSGAVLFIPGIVLVEEED